MTESEEEQLELHEVPEEMSVDATTVFRELIKKFQDDNVSPDIACAGCMQVIVAYMSMVGTDTMVLESDTYSYQVKSTPLGDVNAL